MPKKSHSLICYENGSPQFTSFILLRIFVGICLCITPQFRTFESVRNPFVSSGQNSSNLWIHQCQWPVLFLGVVFKYNHCTDSDNNINNNENYFLCCPSHTDTLCTSFSHEHTTFHCRLLLCVYNDNSVCISHVSMVCECSQCAVLSVGLSFGFGNRGFLWVFGLSINSFLFLVLFSYM